jgi:serine phosphatase RsbU (regulator of sigma subunit)
MSLIVAAADAELSAGLMGRVDEIEAGAAACQDLASVLQACAHAAAPACVICAELGWAEALLDASPRTCVVLISPELPESAVLLRALRAGVADVWTEGMDAMAMRERLGAVRSRAAAAASAAERQLSQYGQELERDQRAGRYVQMGMLPPNPMAMEHYRFQHRIVPSMFMSGDFVDYFRITDRHFVFYVADVSGHGASSAFVTVLLKNFSRRLRREHRPAMLADPGLILEWVNRELLDQRIDKHVALLLGVGNLDTNTVALVNGGHYPPALHVSTDGAEWVDQKGKPVGLFETVNYQSRVVSMAPGDRLVMFSDGVMDAMGAGSLASKESRLAAAGIRSPELDRVWQALDLNGAESRKPDDMTCLLVQREN